MTDTKPARCASACQDRTAGSHVIPALTVSLALHGIAAAAIYGVPGSTIELPEARVVIVDLVSLKRGASADRTTRAEQPSAPSQGAIIRPKLLPASKSAAPEFLKFSSTPFSPKPPVLVTKAETVQVPLPVKLLLTQSMIQPKTAPQKDEPTSKPADGKPALQRAKLPAKAEREITKPAKRKSQVSRKAPDRASRKQGRSKTGKTQGASFSGGGLSNPRPRYPESARRRNQQGRVLLKVSVSAKGRASTVRIYRSSGHRMLDRAALTAVRRWRFRPALRHGRPVTATITVPISFRLKD